MTVKTLTEALDQFVARRLLDVNTSMPGCIVAYDADTQTADVQPAVKQAYTDADGVRQVVPLPIIPDVPVCFPGSGRFKITFPLDKGDHVLIIFSQASIDRWQSEGKLLDPGDDSTHGLSDAIIVPGILPLSEASTQVADALVLSGDPVHLSEHDAAQHSMRGSAFSLAHKDLLTAFDTFFSLLSVATGVSTAAVDAAIIAFNNANLTTDKVKVP